MIKMIICKLFSLLRIHLKTSISVKLFNYLPFALNKITENFLVLRKYLEKLPQKNQNFIKMKCSIIFLSIVILGVIGIRVDDNLNEIYFNGRVSQYNRDFVQFDWSMIEIEMTFYGFSVSAIFKDNQNMYDAYIDGKLVKTFQTTSSQTEYLIANTLNNGKYF